MPDSLREVWAGPRGELSQIEFHTHVAPSRDGLAEAAESWLAGQSSVIERLRIRATQIGSEGSAVVVIHGGPGTGKLRVAQWIHRCGNRSTRPLLVLDADDPTLHSQLDRVIATLTSGLASGASAPGTVALRNFERADEPAIRRLLEILGSQGVELVCALLLITKRNPDQLRDTSLLHAELLARAGNSVVSVPAVRHRGGDVAELARQFAEEAARRYDKSIRGISPQALAKLEAHDFPGNVRELQFIVEQAILRSSGDWVTGECFLGLDDGAAVHTTGESELVIRLPGSSLREIEVQALQLALKLSSGRIVRASELLGITRHALRRKLEKFGLNELRAPSNNPSTQSL
ncbi:Transcriptional regulatory protein ZraR [Enhygromyxa salina]|uniref:Transcriptional regulatory protein ZraR n=1 Tax=Enhygromyxa salina TaxID=215803 RepID=A0A2S9XW71_9BACT|nr:helix-turn-helix domain-containing protein [Enhygromyxa salina]PRP97093.1 Transcriptional regulatory protein ZraR [Enhygromyxa salina]